jgi:hypothetical protein
MATFSQFDEEQLAEAVMRRGQKKYFHGDALPVARGLRKIADTLLG